MLNIPPLPKSGQNVGFMWNAWAQVFGSYLGIEGSWFIKMPFDNWDHLFF
jgi:hypothetical protein